MTSMVHGSNLSVLCVFVYFLPFTLRDTYSLLKFNFAFCFVYRFRLSHKRSNAHSDSVISASMG